MTDPTDTIDRVDPADRIARAAVGSPPRGRWRRRRGDLARLGGRRLAAAVPILVAVSAGVFVLASRSPFDPLAAYLGDRYQHTSTAQKASMSEHLDLDASWWHGWLAWAGDLLGGDLGWSRVYSAPVTQVIGERLGWTVLLSAGALVIAVAAALVGGTLAGLRPGSPLDRICSGCAVVIQAIPPFVLALGGVAVVAVLLRWAPAGGASAPGRAPTVGSVAAHLVLPMLVLALSQLPWLLLSVRASVAASVGSDAVRGARSRGLAPARIVAAHVLPVSLAPLVTIIGARLPELIVGAVLVEEIFAWPGVAGAVVTSAQALDLPLLAALTVATTAAVLAGSLLADAAYLLLDPRVSRDV
ncbi:ABC transporter permease subunit [Pseudactinotalea sp. HY160]|uniref:ABC transporter permease n=1 Tax=Pseudactinotalea sp. HY160 TaxID=2654490 RepID=UPI00128CEE2B|nr:ABC transporter permease [Pseudactinotalea sp. HY160]MPV49689.1 ABC transporter permease subunit [Pseudactinotalea sp. HY160]